MLKRLLADNPLRFRPNPTAILLAIAYGVMLAGGTLFILLFVALASVSQTDAMPSITVPSWLPVGALIGSALSGIMLWRHSGHVLNATSQSVPITFRIAYSIGLGLVIGWWIICLSAGIGFIM